MSGLVEAAITAAFTIIGGVSILVVGQFVVKFVLEPVHEPRKTISQIRFNLSYHAATIHTPTGQSKEISDKAREAVLHSSADLIAKLDMVPPYGVRAASRYASSSSTEGYRRCRSSVARTVNLRISGR